MRKKVFNIEFLKHLDEVQLSCECRVKLYRIESKYIRKEAYIYLSVHPERKREQKNEEWQNRGEEKFAGHVMWKQKRRTGNQTLFLWKQNVCGKLQRKANRKKRISVWKFKVDM